MKYNQYITKKRCKINGIGGNVNIPYGTICDVVDGYIMYKNKIVCACRSQNGKDYFWGYDKYNPDEEIKRQELAEELYNIAPNDSVEDLMKSDNTWNQYGHLEEMITGYMWMWNDDIIDKSYLELNRLMTCIKTNTQP